MEVNPLRSAAHVEASTLPLERVATSTQLTQQEKVKEASRAFEAVLLRQILQESQRPVFKSKYVSNSTTDDIYRDQVVNQLAESISRSGSLGLGNSLAGELQSQGGVSKPAGAGLVPAVRGHTLPRRGEAGMPAGVPPGSLGGSTAGALAKKPKLQSPKHD
jgi:Rod binding domain-containing protein